MTKHKVTNYDGIGKNKVTKYDGIVVMVKVSEISSHFSIITSHVTNHLALSHCSYIGREEINLNYNNI